MRPETAPQAAQRDDVLEQWSSEISRMERSPSPAQPVTRAIGKCGSCVGRAFPYLLARFPLMSLVVILAGSVYVASLVVYPEAKPVQISVGTSLCFAAT